MKIFEAIKWALLGAEFVLFVLAIIYNSQFALRLILYIGMFVLGANIQQIIITVSEKKKKKKEMERFTKAMKNYHGLIITKDDSVKGEAE